MMTIKAPIELKVRTDLLHGYDAFGERIAGNYALMGLEIGEEELLHMVSSPPEIYLADGGSTTIGGDTFVISKNEEKYSVINNMLNRILLSVDSNLTYQDRTYITDALHKLGIRDDRRFMHEVRNMIRESHLEEDFLDHYFEMTMAGESRELREQTLELTKELVEREVYSAENTREDRLSERIMHRLRTGAIYQIVSNFNKSLSDTRVELQESMISAQENVARKLLVQNFLSSIEKAEPGLVYRKEEQRVSKEGETRSVREIRTESRDAGKRIMDRDRSERYERELQEERESQLVRSDRERELRTEPETAEIVYRQEGERETVIPESISAPSERMIHEGKEETETGNVGGGLKEQTLTHEPGTTTVVREIEKLVTASVEGRPVTEVNITQGPEGSVTEAGVSVTERRDVLHELEKTGQYVTEAGEILRRTKEQSDLIYRESEFGEKKTESLLERQREELLREKERLTEREQTAYHEKESTDAAESREVRTDRVTEETLRREDRERLLSGTERTERERITEAGAFVTEHRETERDTEHTERYVTETREILRTEHESSELIHHQRIETSGTEYTETQIPGQETRIIERQISSEKGEAEVPEGQIPGSIVGREILSERSTSEQKTAEYHREESRTEDRETILQGGSVNTEIIREPGREVLTEAEQLREQLKEQLTTEREETSEYTERELRTEGSSVYVTEQGELPRTEHPGTELVYREGEGREVPGEGTETPGPIQETRVYEREYRREAGEPSSTEIRVSRESTERVTEPGSRVSEYTEKEYHADRSSILGQGPEIHTEGEVREVIREVGREVLTESERLREQLKEQLTRERKETSEYTERELRTEGSSVYVTEQGEIPRTEHPGTELVYREGEVREAQGETAETPGTLRETRVHEREYRWEAGEPSSTEVRTTRESTERVTEPGSRVSEYTEKAYITDRSSTLKQGPELRTEGEVREVIREAGREVLTETERLREQLKEQLTREREETSEYTERELQTEHGSVYVTEQGELPHTEHPGEELIYREVREAEPEDYLSGTREILQTVRETGSERLSERERLERERSSVTLREETVSAYRSELREQLEREQLRAERIGGGETPSVQQTIERTEMVHRRIPETGEEAETTERVRQSEREIPHYRSENYYERELLQTERSREEVTSGLTAAVLLDVVKTLFHAGYERIGRGDTWIEYRGALYHSAENTFNRLNYHLEAGDDTRISNYTNEADNVQLQQVDISELQEMTENVTDVERIEQTIREMNEMNLQNVERYQQMLQVLQQIRPKKGSAGGMERTRQEALSLMDDEQALYENLASREGEQEEERKQVFHEITRLFPDRSVEIFRVLEQYLDNNGKTGRADVTRNNIEAAADEIRRITAAPRMVTEPVAETMETESSELVYRRNDRVTQEELQEVMESIRRTQDHQRREIEQRQQQIETERRNTSSVTNNTARTLSREETENIEALVSRGVRSQMGAISEQVLQKLEKKLKNEKIRRGI